LKVNVCVQTNFTQKKSCFKEKILLSLLSLSLSLSLSVCVIITAGIKKVKSDGTERLNILTVTVPHWR